MTDGTLGSRKTALITGASGGIGCELAKVFALNRFDLALVARNEEKLAALGGELVEKHGIYAHVLPRDLSQPESPEEIFRELRDRNAAVDVLVNNAGFGTYGLFRETDLREELEELQVNVVAPTHLTKLFLPGMLGRGYGRIMNVASTAAFQPGPYLAVYAATKAYLLSFSEALASECEGTGVTVTALCPGVTKTGFQERARMGESRLLRRIAMDPQIVARAGYKGLMQGEPIVIPGFQNRLLALLSKIGPRKLVVRAAKAAQEKVG